MVFPMVNMTGPLGITVGDVISAVNVTALPGVEGLADEVSVAALVAGYKLLRTSEELLAFSASPLYTAASG